MSIDDICRRASKLFFFLALVGCPAGFTCASNLQPVTDLVASPGSTPGSIQLTWTNIVAVDYYTIKYDFKIFNSTSYLDWGAANSIGVAPLYLSGPSSSPANTLMSYVIPGLNQGVVYRFMMVVSQGSGANRIDSYLSNAATAQARIAGSMDGKGSANLDTPSIIYGLLTPTTISFTVDASSIMAGGEVVVRVPDYWTQPDKSPGSYWGGVSLTTAGITASLSLDTSGQMIIAHVDSGMLVGGDVVRFHYNAWTCGNYSDNKFRILAKQQRWGNLTEITGSNTTLTPSPGDPAQLRFSNYNLVAPLNQVVPIYVSVADQCNNVVPATSTILFDASATYRGQNGSNWGYFSDSSATVSANNNLPLVPLSGPISIASGQSLATFYYRITNMGDPNNHTVRISYQLGNPWVSDNYMWVRPLTSGITGVSIDTGTPSPGTTHVSFTPAGGPNDNVFVNFSIGDQIGWQITISSDLVNYLNPVMQFGGWGNGGRYSWNGWFCTPGNPCGIAPSGNYGVRIQAEGGAIQDTSLSIEAVTLGVQGTVVDSNGPVADAGVNLYGPTGGRGGPTDSDGKFALYGFKPGNYTLEVRKTGYDDWRSADGGVSIQNDTNTITISTVTLVKAAQLKLTLTRPNTGYMPEIYGNLNADAVTGDKHAWANVHFGVGKSTADMGNNFSDTLSTNVILNLKPATPYNVRFNIPGLSTGPWLNFQISADTDYPPVQLAKSADITGIVTIPVADVQNNGRWFNVEAGIDSDFDGAIDNMNSYSSHYWGGGGFEPNSSTGTFIICGVNPGHYALRAYAPGYAPSTAAVTVVAGVEPDLVEFPPFATGGKATGTITINGDSSSLADSLTGNINLNLNAWSFVTNLGAWAQVQISSSSTSTSAPYLLTGLTDGVYEIWIYLPGFEKEPPGPTRVTIKNGAGSEDIVFKQFSGFVTGSITLPSQPPKDYGKLKIEIQSSGGDNNFQVFTATGPTYQISGLGTNYFNLRALYSPTGALFERSFQAVNGKGTLLDINMSGPVYSISGKVTSSASGVYNSLSYLVDGSTPTTFSDISISTISHRTFPANRIMAVKVNQYSSESTINPDPDYPPYDPYSVFIGTYDSDGNYTISRIPPGTYLLSNNGEMDGNTANGKEIAEIARVVYVKGDLTDQDFTLTDGYNVSGTIRVASGISESPGRDLRLRLKNSSGDSIVEKTVNLQDTQKTYNLDRIPPGTYVLSTEDCGYPKKYSAKDLTIDIVSSNLTNKDISLLRAAKIQGKIQIQPSNILITQDNSSQYISDSFEIAAQADPWFEGGWNNAQNPLIDGNGYFSIYTNPGTFDVIFRNMSGFIGNDQIASGKKQLVPKTIGGIKVEAGATYDLGVVNLTEGSQLTGVVTDKAGTPLPNIMVQGYPSGEGNNNDWNSRLECFTDQLGQYVLYGIDKTGKRFYDIVAAPRPNKGEDQILTGSNVLYGTVLRNQVDTQNVATVSFQLEVAKGSVSGRALAVDGNQIEVPFGGESGNSQLGASIMMNRRGDVPQGNPLGNIEQMTDPDGKFSVLGLLPGSYDLWVLAKGYASKAVRNIEVGETNTDIGDVILSTGAVLSGNLTKIDGSVPNTSEVDALVAVRNGFEELIVGYLKTDPSGNILSYSLAGFQPDKAYSVLLFNKNNEVYSLASNLVVNTNTERDFKMEDKQPEIFTQASRGLDGVINIQFEFTKALRNETTDDSDPSKIITKHQGQANGTLTYPDNGLSSDRRRILVTYTPAQGETQFKLDFEGTFNSINSATGQNFTAAKTFTYYVGIGKSRSKRLTNLGGGSIQLDNDPSEFTAQAGTFVSTDTASTDSANLEVDVTFRVAETAGTLVSEAPISLGGGVMAKAKKLGFIAYPSEMSSAIVKAMAADINPFSSFYDVFLPQGVSHFFPQGKEAKLCLAYDETAADPFSLNVYYYNSRTNEYLLENENKAVDVDNHRVCVNISHASVFTVLDSSAGIISGSGYTGDLRIINFPNPFNLKSKIVTLQNPGSNSASQTIDGTMIKLSIPPAMSGEVEIEIFNVIGEKVRTLRTTIATGGAHYYLEWDGKNDHGEKVASGVYIAHFKIGGANERFFKMAVVK